MIHMGNELDKSYMFGMDVDKTNNKRTLISNTKKSLRHQSEFHAQAN